MKHRLDMKSAILGAFLGAVIVLTVGAATGGRAAWTYQIIYGRLSPTVDLPSIGQQLDQAAANGWQVVAATTENGAPVLILGKPR
jgi:hypothetical protein